VQLLRQFAFLNTVLQGSFPEASISIKRNQQMRSTQPGEASSIDMTLSTLPNPKLTMTFARGSGGDVEVDTTSKNADIGLDEFLSDSVSSEAGPPISVAVSVLPNAEIAIGDNNVWSAQKARKDQDEENSKLARILDVAADLDIWAEFVRSQAVAL
jgi:hypothetical protein